MGVVCIGGVSPQTQPVNMSAEGLSVKESSQSSCTFDHKVKEGAHRFQPGVHLLWGGGVGAGASVNVTTSMLLLEPLASI